MTVRDDNRMRALEHAQMLKTIARLHAENIRLKRDNKQLATWLPRWRGQAFRFAQKAVIYKRLSLSK